MRGLLLLVLLAAACGGEDDRPVTRRECIGFVAHHWMLEDLVDLSDEGLGSELGKELASRRFKNEEEALRMIRTAERGSLDGEGEGERRIARCLAERTRRNVQCAVRATSIAEIERCPR